MQRFYFRPFRRSTPFRIDDIIFPRAIRHSRKPRARPRTRSGLLPLRQRPKKGAQIEAATKTREREYSPVADGSRRPPVTDAGTSVEEKKTHEPSRSPLFGRRTRKRNVSRSGGFSGSSVCLANDVNNAPE